ncbi:MAG: hypothetical protein ABIQ56_01690 [Chitinophagaceae bacterium]
MKPANLQYYLSTILLILLSSWLIIDGSPHSFFANALLINFTFIGDGIYSIFFPSENPRLTAGKFQGKDQHPVNDFFPG